MTWLLAGLAGLVGLFYGMWQRSRYESARRERDNLRADYDKSLVKFGEEQIRYEQVIEDLKTKLFRANQKLVGTADAGGIRDILNELYPPPAK